MTEHRIAFAAVLLAGLGLCLESACTVHSYKQPPPGSTNAPPPVPPPAPTAATDAAPPPTAYDPCVGKKCGDGCTLCDPNDKTCVETAVVKQCSAGLVCEQTVAQCGTTQPPAPAYNACAGKKCGDRCRICPPGDTRCLETATIKLCQTDGSCKEATTVDCTKK